MSVETITYDTAELFPVGTRFNYRGKAKRVGTIVGYIISFDTSTDTTTIKYHATHEFCGQTIHDRDVVRNTILMGGIIEDSEATA